jgi:hypothetical protein
MQKKKVASTRAIDAAKPAAKVYSIRDGATGGLFYLIWPTGRKTVSLMFRFGGRLQKLKLGTWEALGLAGSRKAANAVLAQVSQGTNPISA